MSAPSSPRRRAPPEPIALGLAVLVAGVTLWIHPAGQESFNAPKFALWLAGAGALAALAALRALRGKPFWLLAAPSATALLVALL